MIIYKNIKATFEKNEPVKLSKLEQKKSELKNSFDKKRQDRINKAKKGRL